jgi:hypothetical protein
MSRFPCAALALGRASSVACPASYLPLNTADACKSAAGVANKTYGDSGAYYPAGCYYHTVNGGVYFSTDATGVANYFAQPLCASAA